MQNTTDIQDTLYEFNGLYKEHGQFLEINGEFYCGSDCNQCRYSSVCESEVTEENVANIYPLRGFVRANDFNATYKPYPDDCNTKPRRDNRYNGNILPNQTKRVFKIINSFPEPYKDGEQEFILFHPKQEKYYCIRQQCHDCQYNSSCDYELEIKEDRSLLSAVDIQGQEPHGFLLTTLITQNFELLWAEAFANETIRAEGQVYYILETLFKQAGIDTTIKNEKFQVWLTDVVTNEKHILYELMEKTANYYKEKSSKALQELKEVSSEILNSYNTFKEQ